MHGRNHSGWIRAGALTVLLLAGCDNGENNDASNASDSKNLATDNAKPALPHQRNAATHEVAGFEVRAGKDKVDILRAGNTYWSHTGNDLALETASLNSAGEIPLGTDITGDGLANLIIRESVGDGARYTVLSLGQEVDVLAELDAFKTAPTNSGFRDFDGDGVLEYVTRDQTWTDVLQADAPPVVLRWDGDHYAASARDLARPAPRLDQLEPKIEEIVLAETWKSSGPPAALYQQALDLAYTGHEELALRFVQWAWPENQPGRDEFLAQFTAKLRSSPHYSKMAGEFASAGGG